MKQHKWHKEGDKRISKKQCKECEALKHDLDVYMQANKEMLNKEWQGLTKDEIKSIYIDAGVVIDFTDVVKLIEQKLKEKNHGTT